MKLQATTSVVAFFNLQGMNIAEYAEQLFNLAYSQEMIDFITSLDGASSDEWRMKVTAIQGYYFFVFYKSTNQFFIVGYMRRGNNTTDFVYINLNNAFILSQHQFSRFRKRIIADGIKYDLRGRMFDILEHSIQTLINIYEDIYLCNTGISDKYNDNYFAWTKFGLIPVIRYSDIVFCGTTFISVDMLNEKQKELWDSVHSKLLEQDLLRGNRE